MFELSEVMAAPVESVAEIVCTEPSIGVAFAEGTAVSTAEIETETVLCDDPSAFAGISSTRLLFDTCPPADAVTPETCGTDAEQLERAVSVIFLFVSPSVALIAVERG